MLFSMIKINCLTGSLDIKKIIYLQPKISNDGYKGLKGTI